MVGHLHKLQQKKTRKSPQKGGPWVPGRGGSKNISSRAFLIFMIVKTSYLGDLILDETQEAVHVLVQIVVESGWNMQNKKKKKERRIVSSIKNWEKYQENQGLLFVPIHWDTRIYLKNTNQDNEDSWAKKLIIIENWSDEENRLSQSDGNTFFPVIAEGTLSKR